MCGSARNSARDQYPATPALVLSANQLRNLTRLCLLPLKRRIDGSFSRRPSAPGAADINGTGIGEVQIGANRLRLQAHSPNALGLLPKRKLGISQREMGFFRAGLEIYPCT